MDGAGDALVPRVCVTFARERIRMRSFVKQAGVLLVAAPLIAACSYFGGGSGGESEKPVAMAPVGKLTTECARLQPLFGPSDQELTREKMDEGLKVELTKWDKDSSGGLTHSEVAPLNDALRAENVGASPVTDWNGDGQVDFQEFASGWRTMFELCDRNRNKMVSYRELGHSPNVTPARTVPLPKKEKPQQPQQPEGASSPRGSGY